MSSGSFITVMYMNNQGEWYRCRCQPELLSARFGGIPNSSASRVPRVDGKLKLHMSRREKGLHPRYVWVKFTSSLPSGYKEGIKHKIVIFTMSLYSRLTIGSTGLYLGHAIEVISLSEEYYN